MSGLSKVILAVLACLLLTVFVPTSAKGDTIENLSFDGFASCSDSFCAGFGSGTAFGTYSLDLDTQTIVGAWSFSTPLGIISSTGTGADASVTDRLGDINPAFLLSNPFEFIQFFFPSADTQESSA